MSSGLAAVAQHLQTKSFVARWSGVLQPSYPNNLDLNQLLTSPAQASQNYFDPKAMDQFGSGDSGGKEWNFHAGVNDGPKFSQSKTSRRNRSKKRRRPCSAAQPDRRLKPECNYR